MSIPWSLHQSPQSQARVIRQVFSHTRENIRMSYLSILPSKRDQAPPTLREEVLVINCSSALDLRLPILHGRNGRGDSARVRRELAVRVVDLEVHQAGVGPVGGVFAYYEAVGCGRSVE